jgi:hypothetical protein
MMVEFGYKVQNLYDNAAALLLKKHQDYGPKNISGSPGGPINGLRVRMHDKMARINNLVDNGLDPQNESLKDSFLDLANYAMIALLVLEGEWPDGDHN